MTQVVGHGRPLEIDQHISRMKHCFECMRRAEPVHDPLLLSQCRGVPPQELFVRNLGTPLFVLQEVQLLQRQGGGCCDLPGEG